MYLALLEEAMIKEAIAEELSEEIELLKMAAEEKQRTLFERYPGILTAALGAGLGGLLSEGTPGERLQAMLSTGLVGGALGQLAAEEERAEREALRREVELEMYGIPPEPSGWLQRHPILGGTLIGAGIGVPLGAILSAAAGELAPLALVGGTATGLGLLLGALHWAEKRRLAALKKEIAKEVLLERLKQQQLQNV